MESSKLWSSEGCMGAAESYVGEGRFEDAYSALFVRALRAATAVLGDAATAEDVAAETMARAFVHWSKIARYAPAWVTRVAVNLSLDAARRRHSPVEMAESRPDHLLDRLMLRALLGKLSRRQRAAIVLRYIVDLDEREVAGVLGVSTGTIHTHIRRGLARLRADLVEDLEGERSRP